ncbi:MAG: 1-deoxy-D-xylulose-5-phosphate synthase [Phycisphaerae bacterium]
MGLLETVNSPADIKKMSLDQLTSLAEEIRQVIAHTVSQTGGHLASNLGVVELTLALHYCFDFPEDRLLWDVGHQSYVHKLITGRQDRFSTLRQAGGLSGFPDIHESPYDLFSVGHAGTAIATAAGVAHGDHLAKRNNRVVALVGDASIVNGLSFEGLNNAGLLKRQFLVVLNDNEMAIDVTQGAFAKYLNRLRFTHIYEDFKRRAESMLEHLPLGKSMKDSLHHFKQSLKSALSPGQIFEQMGITYLGPLDGHDLNMLIRALTVVRDAPYPILLHVQTQKGQGYGFASSDPCKFHSPSGYEINGDEAVVKPGKKSYTAAFGECLVELAQKDEKIVALTAAMPDGTGLVDFRQKFPDRYFDVGICESAAVDIAAGLARSGFKPVVAIYSTFLQRAFDQIWQEVILQNLPVIFCIDRAGLVGSDGAVHHGFCDISFLRALPNMICCAPADELELREALTFAFKIGKAVAIRYPRDIVSEPIIPTLLYELGKGRIVREGSDAAIVVYGALMNQAFSAAKMLSVEGIEIAIVSARFAKPLDEELISGLLQSGKPVIIIEDHSKTGGFGSAIFELAQTRGLPIDNVVHMGLPADQLVAHASRDRQLQEVGLDDAGIVRAVKDAMAQKNTNIRLTPA